MRIVQLSDLHIDKGRFKSDNPLPVAKLILDLQEFHDRKKIDLILVSGDIVNQGGFSFNKGRADYYAEIEEKIFKPIYTALGISKKQILIIPGNHDINRNKIDEIYHVGLKSTLVQAADINKHIRKWRTKKNQNLCGTLKYNEYLKSRYGKIKTGYLSNFESVFTVNYQGVKIGIGAFNSSWFCFNESDKEKVPFGTQQIHDAGDYLTKSKSAFNIGMIHHPLDRLSNEEASETEQLLAQEEFGVLLCGHLHKDDNVLQQRHGNQLIISMARSVFNNTEESIEQFKSGYKIIDFGYSVDNFIQLSINYRKYTKNKIYDVDSDSGKKAGEETCQIPVTKRNKPFYEVLKKNNKQLTSERQALITEMSDRAKRMLISNFPYISDKILSSINTKILGFYEFAHFRRNISLEYVIKPCFSGHFELEETQKFEIVSDGQPFVYEIEAHVDCSDSGKDKSKIIINKLVINEKEYTKSVRLKSSLLSVGKNDSITRQSLSFSKTFSGQSLYKVVRIQTSIHTLQSNGIWKTDTGVIMDNVSLSVKNSGNFKVDIVQFGNNTNFKAKSGGLDQTLLKNDIIEADHEDILIPGDGFVIVVNEL